ncbi:unnamed protein product [Rodentolepis nana]|uniref:G_PROTEIN_RECEP_F3_4 domain-containing protein n=1 Tax=Rodentolepis nana TaxID=102285 RepID=A0A0R3TTN1_RODNA|nr:unnamed protein product [Rodentolepis nana]
MPTPCLRTSNSTPTPDQQDLEMKGSKLKHQVDMGSRETTRFCHRTAGDRSAITATSSLQHLVASCSQSTNAVQPHTRSMPHFKVDMVAKKTMEHNNGFGVLLFAALCCVLVKFVLFFTPMEHTPSVLTLLLAVFKNTSIVVACIASHSQVVVQRGFQPSTLPFPFPTTCTSKFSPIPPLIQDPLPLKCNDGFGLPCFI